MKDGADLVDVTPDSTLRLVTEGSAWGGAVSRKGEFSYVAVALHSENELGVWRVGNDRGVARLGVGLDTGYHPDGVATWSEDVFVVAVEGIRRIQFWQLSSDVPVKIVDFEAPFPVRDVLVADLDGDGHKDLLLSPYRGSRLAVLWGQDGEYRFSEAQYLEGAQSGWHPIAVDWTGNGLPDLIWGELDSGVVRIARNTGDRRFEVVPLHEVTGTTPRQVAFGYFGDDRRPVLAVAVEIGDVELLFPDMQEAGSLEVKKIKAPGLGYVSVAVMADGTIALGEEGRVMLLRQTGDGWEKRQIQAFSMPAPLDVADVDGDGHDDLVVYHSSGTDGTLIHFGPLWDKAAPLAENVR